MAVPFDTARGLKRGYTYVYTYDIYTICIFINLPIKKTLHINSILHINPYKSKKQEKNMALEVYIVFGKFAVENKGQTHFHAFSGMIEENNKDRTFTGRTIDKFGHANIRGSVNGNGIELTKTYDRTNRKYDYELAQREKGTYSGRWIGERSKGNVVCLILKTTYDSQTIGILDFLREGDSGERMFTKP